MSEQTLPEPMLDVRQVAAWQLPFHGRVEMVSRRYAAATAGNRHGSALEMGRH